MGQGAMDCARDAILRPGASPSTILRNLIAPVRAVMHFSARRDWCQEPRLSAPSQPEGRTVCPLPSEFERLRQAMPARGTLLTWYISTGCRRGETQALQWQDVDLQGATARLWADTTKAGKVRIVHLVPAAVVALAALPHRVGSVFGGEDIKTAWHRACRDTGLDWPGVHTLRHGWASWHYALYRDLLKLKVEGGWSSTEQVEQYAHLMPVGHEEAIRRIWGLATPQRQRFSRIA